MNKKTRAGILSLTVAAVLLGGVSVQAQITNINWIAPSSDAYTDPAAWDLGVVPDATNYFAYATNGTATYADTMTNALGALQIGTMDDASATFTMSGGELDITNTSGGNFVLGDGTGTGSTGGSGTFSMSDGSLSVVRVSGNGQQDGFQIGFGTNATGTFTISGGTAAILCGIEVGQLGVGTMNINGGTLIDNGWFGLGRGGPTTAPFTGSGTLNMSAGVLYILNNSGNQLYLSQNATNGVFNLSGGAIYGNGIKLGPNTASQTGSQSIINMSGGNLYIGSQGVVSNAVATDNPQAVNISGGTFHTVDLLPITSVADAGDTNTILADGTNWSWTANPPVNLTNSTFLVSGQSGPGYVTFAPEATRTITLNNQWSGVGGLTVNGPGAVVMTAANNYSGDTTISQGTLALTGSGSLASANIIVAGGATIDTSASSFSLGAGQTLTNSSSTAVVNGLTATAGTISLIYDGSTPSLTVASGTLTLGSGATFNINNTGAALAAGDYKIISSTGGVVAGGALPSVTVGGGGIVGGAVAFLYLSGGELYLSVGTGTPIISAQNPSSAFNGYTLQQITLSVTAFGPASGGALTYQWFTNGVADDTAGTGSTYRLPSVGSGNGLNGESYSCAVGNTYASATNVTATLTVLSLPADDNNPFAGNLLGLNPVAYWPLQETVQPPVADMETNIGSLGEVANAYYSSTNDYEGNGGSTADTGDASVYLNGNNGDFLAVPTGDGRVDLTNATAFTVEAWVNPSAYGNYIGLVSEAGVNPGGLNNSTYRGGWVLSENYLGYLDKPSRGWSLHVYNGQGAANGNPQGGAEAGIVYNYATNTWYYLAAVFDGTNCTLYLNGTNITSLNTGYTIPMTGSFVPDTWDQLCIGCGRGLNGNHFVGGMDEVAIYTNALSAARVQAHYNAAGGSYSGTVMSDSPYMYWRMDAPPGWMNPPAISDYPVAANDGSAANINGLDLSGTTPGVAGPALAGLGSPSYACAFNGIGTDSTNSTAIFDNGIPVTTNVLNSGVLITNVDPALDMTNQPETLMCWFKGNPADNRFQDLVGIHGDLGPRLALYNGGNAGEVAWYCGSGGNLTSPVIYNDGNWHFVVGVYDNAGSTATGMNYLYVDGVLVNSAASTSAQNPTLTNRTVMLGGAPDYTVSGNGNGYNQRFFSGSLAQAAFFTNALTAAQIINLYTNATAGSPPPPPFITAQPYPYPSIRTVVAGPGVYIYEAVVASGGTPDLGYQWYYSADSNYDGTALVDDAVHYIDSQASQVTITNLTAGDSGYYYCVVNNDYGATTSAIVNVQVVTAPVITAQDPTGPFNLFVNQSYPVSVTVAAETNDLAYQWFTNGVADPNGTGATYATAPATADMAGVTYQCIVTNDFGSATSEVATLTAVNPLPASITNSAYATNILALNPTVYFPMHETASAAPADIETNYGTLGALGDGTYADWNENSGFPDDQFVLHQIPGVWTNDPEGATFFNFNGTTANSYLLVPHTSPQTTMTPPFTIEAWVWGSSVSKGFGDIVSEDGTTLNTGDANNKYGIRLAWGGNAGASPNVQVYVGTYGAPASLTTTFDQWHYVALICDTNGGTTNFTLYVDNNSSYKSGSGFLPDSWDPLTIGNGLWNHTGPTRASSDLGVDEVAIYNTNLDSSTINTHYNDGRNGTSSQYFMDVTNLNPVLYYRMDSPAYSGVPDMGTWPVMTNYGSASVNGVYSPGLAPGSVAGPDNGVSLDTILSGTNAAACNGMNTFAEAYDPAAFDPATATTPFSVSLWFKGNPSDARYQSLTSGGTGWAINQGQNGTFQYMVDYPYLMNSHGVYNDGKWHQLVMTYGANTLSLYVDGQLDTSTNSASYTNIPPDTADYTGIGCDTRFLASSLVNGVGRQYAGNVCEFALWNGTALTAGQVASLYDASGMAPTITTQPKSASVNARTAFTNTVAGFGPGPLMYQWYRDGQELPIGGQTNLTIDATNASLIIDPVKSSDASSNYYAVISNNYGSATSSVASLYVFSEPEFTNEPVDITYTNSILLFAGASPTFKVASVGAQPTYYQWFTNDAAATANDPALTNYTLPPTQLGSGVTNFYCVASNFISETTNTPVSITVLADPTAPYPSNVLALNPVGFWRLNEPDDGDESSDGNAGVIADDYWSANNGIYTNTGLGGYYGFLGTPGYYSTLDTSTNPAGFGLAFANSDAYGVQGIDFSAPSNTSAAFTVEAWVNGYQQTSGGGIVTKGYGNGGEQFCIDTGAGGSAYDFRFFVRDASGAAHDANSTIALASLGTWHHLVGVCDEANGAMMLYVDGAVAATASITPGSGILASTYPMTIGARSSSQANGIINSNNLQFVGFVSDVAAYNYALSASQVAAQYAVAGVPPNFTQAAPTNATANGFGSLTIPASLVGTPVLGYAWSDVSGATNVASGVTNGPLLDATLAVTNVPFGWNNDTLELTVTNAYGTTNVFVALTVYTNAPQITVDLPPQVVAAAGKPWMYSISVVGPQPYYYQWYSNGVPIGSATNSTYSLVAGGAGGTATYSVVITNFVGSTTSSPSIFTSIALPSGSAYVTNVLALNPVGYWPLQETSAPAPATIETNYGSFGALGNGYYVGTNAGSMVSFGQTGALTNGDSDSSVLFNSYNPANGQGYVVVPSVSPRLALNPPFTLECWADPITSDSFGDLVGNRGTSLDNPAAGVSAGVVIQWEHTPFQFSFYAGNGTGQTEVREPDTVTPGGWHHLVLTCDANTNFTLYVDGVNEASQYLPYVPSLWNPLTIGAGFWDWTKAFSPYRGYSGGEDEVAVYTNALTSGQVMNHYLAGTTPGSNYVATITGDSPLLYYRMDAAGYTNPPATLYPTAVNFGSASVNGSYISGITPGGVSGPTNSVLGMNVLAAPINGAFSCVDAGYDPAFNPTGTQSFTAMTWFRTYPADSRVQTIMGQGTNWAMNLDGTTGRVVWNLYNGGQVTSTGVLNDGNWHFIAGVYDGANSYLYVDGALDNSGPAPGGLTGESNTDLFLGGSADYTALGTTERYFAGALAQAALFTNALTADQIQAVYTGSALQTTIVPTNSATITGFSIAGQNVVISGTNGTAGGTYYLLGSTNVATPFSQWTPVATNVVGSTSFTFTGTNVVSPNGLQQYFILSNTN